MNVLRKLAWLKRITDGNLGAGPLAAGGFEGVFEIFLGDLCKFLEKKLF